MRLRACIPAVLLAVAAALPAEDLLERTLPLRSALHQDPTLDAPLERLVQAWRTAGRLSELVGVYRDHLASYPDDRNAAAVLIRLQLAAGDQDALATSGVAVASQAEDSYLWWLRYRALAAARDGGALDALDKAVGLETAPWRRKAWAERLVELALKAGRPELARRHLAAAAGGDDSPAGRLATARRQAQAGLHVEALATLAGVTGATPELAIELDLLAADEEAALGRGADAAKRLDGILARLAADHWRRAEVLRRRVALAATAEEREALVAAARAKAAAAPGDEAAQIDVARLLTATDRRREALDLLLAACARSPSPRLEQEILAAFDRVHDPAGLDAWLAARLAVDPARGDLAAQRVRALIEGERRDDAWKLLDASLARLPAAEGDDRLLALGRDLMRSGRSADAAEPLSRLHLRRPARLDAARELADAWVAAGRRDRAEALFAGGLPADAAPEQVLETVQFLAGRKMPATAMRLADERLKADPGHFELRLAAMRLAAKTGDGAGAELAAAAARPLADTPARYRRWLEVAIEAAGQERAPTLLAAERTALDAEPGGWDESRAARRSAFAEACIAADARDLALALLRADLAAEPGPPAEKRPALRRSLIGLLGGPDDGEELRKQLTALGEEDPAAAPDALVRAALVGVAPEETAAHLADVEPAELSDPQLLDRVWQAFADANDGARALAAAERLVQLEPANPQRWERWLASYAAVGDEAGLRAAARRLLAGVENLELKPEVRDRLQDAALASVWRSAARAAAGGRWDEALGLAAEAEPLVRDRDQGCWVAWTRAVALARLGRAEAAEALAELDRRAAGEDTLLFPDGLATTVAATRALLAAAAPQPPSAARRRGPLPPWRAAWAFDAPADLLAILPAKEALLVCDGAGTVHALDPATGRLRWTATGLAQAGRDSVDPETGEQVHAAERLPVLADGVLVAVEGGGIVAREMATGRPRWRSSVLPKASGIAGGGALVVAWDDADGRCIGLDAATGRVRWVESLPELGGTGPAPGPEGAIGDGLVAITGRHGGVLDAVTGGLRWAWSAAEVDPPTPSLAPAPAAAAAMAATPSPAVFRAGMRRYRHRYSHYGFGAPFGVPGAFANIAYLSSVNGTIFSAAQPQQPRLVATLLGLELGATQLRPSFAGGRLLLASIPADGQPQTLATVDLALPLAADQFPGAQSGGSWAGRLLLLRPDGASVRDLARAQDHDLDLAHLRAEGTSVSPVAAIDGRLAWLAGPGGIAGFDLERGEEVAAGPWPEGLAPAEGTAPPSQGLRGTVAAGLLVLPASPRRLVAIAGRGGDAGGTDVP